MSSTALFSSFFVAQPDALVTLAPPSKVPGRKSGSRGRRTASSAQTRQRRDLVIQAFCASLERVLRQEVVSWSTNLDEIGDLASLLGGHVADILAGRSVVLKLGRDLGEVDREAIETFLTRTIRATETLESARQEAAIAKLAEVILPDPLMQARGSIALDNLELRDRFVAENELLTSAVVGRQSGHRSRNPYATAARWKKAGKIFSVNHRGAESFPAFQFRDGEPRPAIAKILAALPRTMTPWQIAFWFVSTNGWLDGDAPKDRLDDEDAVTAAAGHEGEEVMG